MLLAFLFGKPKFVIDDANLVLAAGLALEPTVDTPVSLARLLSPGSFVAFMVAR